MSCRVTKETFNNNRKPGYKQNRYWTAFIKQKQRGGHYAFAVLDHFHCSLLIMSAWLQTKRADMDTCAFAVLYHFYRGISLMIVQCCSLIQRKLSTKRFDQLYSVQKCFSRYFCHSQHSRDSGLLPLSYMAPVIWTGFQDSAEFRESSSNLLWMEKKKHLKRLWTMQWSVVI